MAVPAALGVPSKPRDANSHGHSPCHESSSPTLPGSIHKGPHACTHHAPLAQLLYLLQAQPCPTAALPPFLPAPPFQSTWLCSWDHLLSALVLALPVAPRPHPRPHTGSAEALGFAERNGHRPETRGESPSSSSLMEPGRWASTRISTAGTPTSRSGTAANPHRSCPKAHRAKTEAASPRHYGEDRAPRPVGTGPLGQGCWCTQQAESEWGRHSSGACLPPDTEEGAAGVLPGLPLPPGS